MSAHNQLLVSYTRQCRNPPARLPVFCRNKVPQPHGKFYQETSSVNRGEHVWTVWRVNNSLNDDKGKASTRNSVDNTSNQSSAIKDCQTQMKSFVKVTKQPVFRLLLIPADSDCFRRWVQVRTLKFCFLADILSFHPQLVHQHYSTAVPSYIMWKHLNLSMIHKKEQQLFQHTQIRQG